MVQINNEYYETIKLTKNQEFRSYKKRWYLLLLFSIISFLQCLIWFTFSPTATIVEEYYDIGDRDVDRLLNYGPIMFLTTIPLSLPLMNRPKGVRYSTLFVCVLLSLCCIIRVIPSLPFVTFTQNKTLSYWLLLTPAQILNAIAGPFVMSLAPLISAIWFPSNERVLSTSIATLAQPMGTLGGFVLIPSIIKEGSDIQCIFCS
eukprot:TRINITY_DN4121_c0_g1_i1.p1 TRINITY_DN4121_c0_g1~~TRINITY_DN4121_c0_g1_i1.p1  ORF type:complete len:203 (-),score=15.87 TRINITY_DN4121_c0_g1_i1:678-1286(-)